MTEDSPVSLSSVEQLSARITRDSDLSGFGQWQLPLPALRRHAQVDLSADWLSISLPLRTRAHPVTITHIQRMLDRNGQLDGAARIIGHNLERTREAIVEIPRDTLPGDKDTLCGQIDDLIESLCAAALEAAPAPQTSARMMPPAVAREADSETFPMCWDERLSATMDELGWPLSQTDGDNFEIPLDVPAAYIAARVRREGGLVTLQVPVLTETFDSASPPGQAAVAVLLWLVANRIRMVKPARVRGVLAVSVTLPAAQATAAALVHGCRALSVALQQFVPESDRLSADERLAGAYLRTIGMDFATRGVSRSRRTELPG